MIQENISHMVPPDGLKIFYLNTTAPRTSKLPNMTEIMMSPGFSINRASTGVCLLRIGPYAVKIGYGVSIVEGLNLLYVRKKTRINVPTVYAVFRDTRIGMNVIIEDHVKGDLLLTLWPKMHDRGKKVVSGVLQQYVQQLRKLPTKPYFGSLGGRGLRDPLFNSKHRLGKCGKGPFTDEAGFAEVIVSSIDARLHPHIKRVMSGHESVFTHAQLYPWNIIVGQKGITLIGWENAGWYPSCWEFLRAEVGPHWDYDHLDAEWRNCLGHILDLYPEVYNTFHKVSICQSSGVDWHDDDEVWMKMAYDKEVEFAAATWDDPIPASIPDWPVLEPTEDAQAAGQTGTTATDPWEEWIAWYASLSASSSQRVLEAAEDIPPTVTDPWGEWSSDWEAEAMAWDASLSANSRQRVLETAGDIPPTESAKSQLATSQQPDKHGDQPSDQHHHDQHRNGQLQEQRRDYDRELHQDQQPASESDVWPPQTPQAPQTLQAPQ
jgi:hypothetical protein